MTRMRLAFVGLLLAACGSVEVGRPDDDARMAWWREARFGLFIHWGLYAIPAGRWGGETDHGEWIRTTARIPREEYDRLVERFDPVAFDAREWARLARRAGMGYVVITSKHHDGFCLFDSEHTDYDVGSTPLGRDVLAELAEACRAEGLRIGWYHSILDWHHPDYLPSISWEEPAAEEADFERYVAHLRAQVSELLTRYGPVGVMWFDGEWEPTWTHEHGRALYELCRELQPDVIVNNRVDKGRGGMAGMTTDARFAGDFGTPEQEVPSTGFPGVDWETCMTMNRHWGWNAADEDWKSGAELVRQLVDVASKGGNFLLNVGPTADGRFPPRAVERLEAIGAWMDVHGEAIRGTRAAPVESLPFGRCTQRTVPGGTRLYLTVFDWPADGRLVVPGLGNHVRRAWALADPGGDLPARSEGPNLVVEVGAAPAGEVRSGETPALCPVIAAEVEGEPVVHRRPAISAPAGTFVHPLAVELALPAELAGATPVLAVRYTLDGSTPDAGSPLYRGPIRIADTATLKARTFVDGRPVLATSERVFRRVEPLPAVAFPSLEPGLAVAVFEGTWDALPDLDALEPRTRVVTPAVGLPPELAREHVGAVFSGSLAVPADDVWTFALTSDDGSRLWIDGQLVVDHDGPHVAVERRGDVPLAAGRHRFRLEWFNRTGDHALELRLGRAGEEPAPIPAAAFAHPPGGRRADR